MLLVVVATTLLVSAVCSLFEATLYSTRIATLEAARRSGDHQRTAALFWAMKKNVGAPTAAILILNTIANTAGATLAGMMADRVFGTSYIFAFSGVFTLAILLFSEIVPKTYGATHWRTLWPLIAWPLAVTQKIMMPLVWLTQKVSGLLVARQPASLTTADEVLAMIQLGARSGQLTSAAYELLTNVFHFEEIVVRQIMVPRSEVEFLDSSWSLEHTLDVVRKVRHTRYPLCDGSLDAPVGIIHVKELLGVEATVSLEALARPVFSVPATMPIPKLLRDMKQKQQHLALVMDEYGAIAGIVTLENLIEEIIGSIQDEFDDEEQPEIVAEESGSYIALGTTLVFRINRRLGIDLSHARGMDTMSGLLVRELGRFPEVGDRIDLPGVEAEVLEVEGNRASLVRLTVPDRA
jgi:CBS domain containing-hemolysin-like protein